MPIDFAADLENIFLNGDFGETITWISEGTETEISANVKRGSMQLQNFGGKEVGVQGNCMLTVAAADVTPNLRDQFKLATGEQFEVEAYDPPQEEAITVMGKRVFHKRTGAPDAKEKL